jgi:hypothetical protein
MTKGRDTVNEAAGSKGACLIAGQAASGSGWDWLRDASTNCGRAMAVAQRCNA